MHLHPIIWESQTSLVDYFENIGLPVIIKVLPCWLREVEPNKIRHRWTINVYCREIQYQLRKLYWYYYWSDYQKRLVGPSYPSSQTQEVEDILQTMKSLYCSTQYFLLHCTDEHWTIQYLCTGIGIAILPWKMSNTPEIPEKFVWSKCVHCSSGHFR